MPEFIPLKFARRFPRAKLDPPSKRRIAAAERAVRREAETLLPGFQRDKTAADRLARMDAATERWWQKIRDSKASNWREARKILRQMPPDERCAFVEHWNTCSAPKEPEYCMDMLRHWKTNGKNTR
jgi:hypothetical protein